MATCNLSAGRNEVCKDSIGGLEAVYFLNYTSASFDKNAELEISGLPSGSTVYKYELKGTSAYTETVNSSRENGTTFFEQTLNLTLHKLTKEDNKELKLLAYGRPVIVVEDYNGNLFVMGVENGADLSGGTIVTGAAMGDLSGYTLTFTGMEKAPANFIFKTSATETILTTLDNAFVNVQVGT